MMPGLRSRISPDPEKSEDGIGSESDVECFQNFTAPEVFTQGLAGMVNQQDVSTIIRSQKYMLTRFEKTNEMLMNCNALSATRYQNAMIDFKKHTQMLVAMRKDIDNIFKRIRAIKVKLAQQYPVEYEIAATTQRKEKSTREREDSEDDEPTVSSTTLTASLIGKGAVVEGNAASVGVSSEPTTPQKLESDV